MLYATLHTCSFDIIQHGLSRARVTWPYYRLFFTLVTSFGYEKVGIQKIKKHFCSKISSIF